jgi:Zn-dependent M28 family amino/carboxypeptidase
LIEASKVSARVKAPDFQIHIPVLFVPYTQLDEERVRTILSQKEALFEINIGFKETRFQDANIGGMIEGYDPEKKREFLLLGAHYDHFGRDEKNGVVYSGGDENAPGVSALLEIGRSLMKRKTDLKRSVLLIFFGGEEWGSWGSRDFVNQPSVPLTQIKAMFCLDTVGGITDEKEVFLSGSPNPSSLTRISKKFLEPLGIKEGKNGDAAFPDSGGDRHPFQERGIPVLAFFASEGRRIRTSRDHPEPIDVETWVDVTRLITLTSYEFLTEP